jgi:hypothetical protein
MQCLFGIMVMYLYERWGYIVEILKSEKFILEIDNLKIGICFSANHVR